MADEPQEESTPDEESVESAVQEDAEEAVEGEAKPKKVRSKKTRVVRRRKSKKEKERPLTGAIRLAVESGKVDFGSRTASEKAKLFVVAGNAQPDVKAKVAAMSKAAGMPVIEFEGSSMELGSICGKPFPVSVLSIYDEGSSNILELAKGK
ncbi:MAG: 50S ribosomal protein L30e [Candidatus ainarchaeum sp.]|nr:50S ribosomal protein L30e [Candidatus ainarchaeum sp.]